MAYAGNTHIHAVQSDTDNIHKPPARAQITVHGSLFTHTSKEKNTNEFIISVCHSTHCPAWQHWCMADFMSSLLGYFHIFPIRESWYETLGLFHRWVIPRENPVCIPKEQHCLNRYECESDVKALSSHHSAVCPMCLYVKPTLSLIHTCTHTHKKKNEIRFNVRF